MKCRLKCLTEADVLWIEEGDAVVTAGEIAAGPRIGVDYAGEAALWPLRFFVKDDPAVSRR